MMQYLSAIQSAIKAKAPIVAIPVEGHAPVCVRQKLLKGALKGVTITSIEVVSVDAGNRLLKISGRAGNVRTSCKIVAIDRRTAQNELGKWSQKEKAKADKQAMLGALATPAGRKAAKLAEMEGVASDELNELQAQQKELLQPATDALSTHRISRERELLKENSLHLAAHHALPRHIIKQCAVLTYRNTQTRAQIREVSKYNPNRRRSTKRPFLRAKAAAQLINLVRELVERKAELKRIRPCAIADPRFAEYDHMAIHPELHPFRHLGNVRSRIEGSFGVNRPFLYDHAAALNSRRNRAELLRTIRANIAALQPPVDVAETISEAAPAPAPVKQAHKEPFVFVRFSSHRQRDYGLRSLEAAHLPAPPAFYSQEAGNHRGIYMVSPETAQFLLNPNLYCRDNAPTVMRKVDDLAPCFDQILRPAESEYARKLMYRRFQRSYVDAGNYQAA